MGEMKRVWTPVETMVMGTPQKTEPHKTRMLVVGTMAAEMTPAETTVVRETRVVTPVR
jgi:hypothetical protein